MKTPALRGLVPMDVESHACLASLLDEALVRHGPKVALIEANRRRESRRLTYRDVDRAASGVHQRLQALGIGVGDRVAILMSNQPSWLITAIAVFRCGAVLVPLDFKLEPQAQADLLEHAGPSLLVTEFAVFRALPDEALGGGRIWVTEVPEGHVLPAGAEAFDAV
ncbi:MAG: acyl--CoA ligase, partial [Myxococcales bacterium]|nr:acyl--CoA ligase [Myxococcales bacterium]